MADGTEDDTVAGMFDDAPSDEELQATGGEVEIPEQEAQEELAAQEPKAEPKEEPKDEPEAKKESTVPYGALAEERERRKNLEAEMNKNRELMARMEERFKMIQEKITTPEEPPPPSYEDDPGAHLKTRLDKIEGLTREQVEARQRAETEQQQLHQVRQFQQTVMGQEQEFAKQAPDYFDAVTNLRQTQLNEMVSAGYDPNQAEQIINSYAYEIAAQNIRQGKNPAEAFYNLAKLRGYTPQQQKTLEKVNEGMQKAASLGAGGESAKPDLSLQDLATMSDAEFSKATSGNNWAKLWH